LTLFYQPELVEGATWLTEEESKHCIKVLRKREGDVITITDGLGFFYECAITKASASRCEISIQKKTAGPKKDFSVHIAIAPTKSPDRMEWFVEKVTEVGVDEITLLDCEHSERTFLKTERLKKVAISAMKQSQKATLPVINPLQPFQSILQTNADQRFIAFVDHANPKHLFSVAKKSGEYLVLIGPEGDFSAKELTAAINAGFTNVSLGHSRLRTETAGLAACCFLNVLNR
jgi:16S rRNA (uracil1498-N3)-methyltransferase